MAKVYRLYVGMLVALTLCKYCLAEWNATEDTANRTVSHCHRHGNRDNCTDLTATESWSHFSKCPKELKDYCIHGECRYVEAQKAPSCRCLHGYIGSRCEYVNLDEQIGEKRQIIIACIIAALVALILLVVVICICSQQRYRLCLRRGRRREEARNGTEKMSMMDTTAAPTTLTPDSAEPLDTNAV